MSTASQLLSRRLAPTRAMHSHTLQLCRFAICSKLIQYVINIYFLHFPTHVDIPVSECCMAAPKGVLGVEASVDDPGDAVSKLNLNRED